MFCSVCGYNVPDDAEFCPACGAKLIKDSSENRDVQYNQEQSPSEIYNQNMQNNNYMTNVRNVQMPNTIPDQAAMNEKVDMVNAQKNSKGLIIALITLVGVLAVGITVCVVLLLKKDDSNTESDGSGYATVADNTTSGGTQEVTEITENTESVTTEAISTEAETEATTEINTEEIVISGNDVPSEEEAEKACRALYDQAVNFAKNGDYEGYKKICRWDDEKSIQETYDRLKDKVVADGYPDVSSHVLWGDGTYYVLYVMNSLTSGTYPDTRSMWSSQYLYVSYIENEWKYEFRKTAQECFKKANDDVYPKEMLERANAGGNAVDCSDADYSWVDAAIVVPGALNGNVYLAWQNEDGSIDLLLNIKNGTNEIRSVKSVDINMEDDTLGEIFSITMSGDMIQPNKANNYTIHVDATDVKTGTATWGHVGFNVHITAD